MDREIALAPLWERVKARRRNILILVLVSTAVVAGIAFILKPWYRAETELLPPSEEESGVGVASLLRGMGMPGVKIPTEVAPGDVFMVILQSRGIIPPFTGFPAWRALQGTTEAESSVTDRDDHRSPA